jgi:hypothetical protein
MPASFKADAMAGAATHVGMVYASTIIDFGGATMMVRCIDNLLQSDILTEGHLYEVLAERDDCYVLSGFDKGFSKRRFEIVSQPTIEFSGRVAAA